ncbi:MAG: exodeoxyribonuclease VII small subunit [Bacteroidales bacterium]|nr:exodeoxyribonuclease VII small subunit [Bacteroidales bacterium]MDD6581448.1 exodeoxyribonuclease VII small subunit [Bacteroidales bacterium]
MPESKLTYTDAFEELQKIVKKMENADISVDELTKNIERASELIKICKEKLSKTEAEVNKIIGQNN